MPELYIWHRLPPARVLQFEANHLKTLGDDGWFVCFRLYAPEQPFFDRTFKLEDFEMVE